MTVNCMGNTALVAFQGYDNLYSIDHSFACDRWTQDSDCDHDRDHTRD